MKKVAMIGLDGMAWHLLNKLFEWGVMPNLQKITNNSAKGTLHSTIPPESAPAWTSMATGVNPGKHGIFGFTKPAKDYSEIKIMSSRDVKYLRIHEMVASQNLKSVCINQLLTYPIKKIPGSSVITDWLSPEIKFSPEITQYAKDYRGPTLGEQQPLLQKDWNAEYLDLSSRINTVNKLLQEVDWNLFWVVYSEPDHLFHRYYDLVMKKDQRVMKLFTKIDETFAIIRDFTDLLIITSDHGFNMFKHGVYVNTVLEKPGFVKRIKQQTTKDISCQRQVAEQKINLHLPEKLYKYLYFLPSSIELVLLKIYKQLLKVDVKAQLTTHIDIKSSKAFVHGYGVYVKDKKLINSILFMLRQMNFIGGIWKKEELYHGNHLRAMPDLIILPNINQGYAFRGDIIAPKPVIRRNFSSHHPDGIIILNEDTVEPSQLKEVSIYDIAPTIINFLGLKVSEDTDGKQINFN